jgi:hypothetical protein
MNLVRPIVSVFSSLPKESLPVCITSPGKVGFISLVAGPDPGPPLRVSIAFEEDVFT